MKNDAEDRELERLEAELDATLGSPNTPPVELEPHVAARLIFQEHGQLVSKYHQTKMAGRVSTIVGDKAMAQQQFAHARQLLQRIIALRAVAEEYGALEEYEKGMAQWREAQQRAGRAVDGDASELGPNEVRDTTVRELRERRAKK